MNFLDVSRPTPAENLALDEALLLSANQATTPHETLRLWEEPAPVVIVGRGSRVEAEVDIAACRRNRIALVRRCSGGCAVVAGPGCLMYSVILDLRLRPELRVIDPAHAFVLEQTRSAIASCVPPGNSLIVKQAGLSDLVIDVPTGEQVNTSQLKFSGNSLRITRNALLYHGTVLYDFSLNLIGELIRFPPRKPAYRGDRAHHEFVTNLPLDVTTIRTAIQRIWLATKHPMQWPETLMNQLAEEKYSQHEWNWRH